MGARADANPPCPLPIPSSDGSETFAHLTDRVPPPSPSYILSFSSFPSFEFRRTAGGSSKSGKSDRSDDNSDDNRDSSHDRRGGSDDDSNESDIEDDRKSNKGRDGSGSDDDRKSKKGRDGSGSDDDRKSKKGRDGSESDDDRKSKKGRDDSGSDDDTKSKKSDDGSDGGEDNRATLTPSFSPTSFPSDAPVTPPPTDPPTAGHTNEPTAAPQTPGPTGAPVDPPTMPPTTDGPTMTRQTPGPTGAPVDPPTTPPAMIPPRTPGPTGTPVLSRTAPLPPPTDGPAEALPASQDPTGAPVGKEEPTTTSFSPLTDSPVSEPPTDAPILEPPIDAPILEPLTQSPTVGAVGGKDEVRPTGSPASSGGRLVDVEQIRSPRPMQIKFRFGINTSPSSGVTLQSIATGDNSTAAVMTDLEATLDKFWEEEVRKALSIAVAAAAVPGEEEGPAARSLLRLGDQRDREEEEHGSRGLTVDYNGSRHVTFNVIDCVECPQSISGSCFLVNSTATLDVLPGEDLPSFGDMFVSTVEDDIQSGLLNTILKEVNRNSIILRIVAAEGLGPPLPGSKTLPLTLVTQGEAAPTPAPEGWVPTSNARKFWGIFYRALKFGVVMVVIFGLIIASMAVFNWHNNRCRQNGKLSVLSDERDPLMVTPDAVASYSYPGTTHKEG